MMTREPSLLVAILVTLAAVIPGPAAQPNIIVVVAGAVGYGEVEGSPAKDLGV